MKVKFKISLLIRVQNAESKEPEFFQVEPGLGPGWKKSGFNPGPGKRKWRPGPEPGRLNPDPDPDFAIPSLLPQKVLGDQKDEVKLGILYQKIKNPGGFDLPVIFLKKAT